MSRVDHAWLRMDSPANLLMVNSVLWTDKPVDDAAMRAVISERMVERFHASPNGPRARPGC